MSENFYDILGIDKHANGDEIKKAYRKLSMKWHPDKNKNNKDAVTQFQKINESYETLSDDKKRRQYDLFENNPFMKMSGGNSMEVPIDELIGSLFGGMPGMGIPFSNQSMFTNNPNVHVFHGNFPMNMNQSLQKPVPILKNISIPIEKILSGCSVPVEIERWIMDNGTKIFEKETIYATIPQGVDDDEIIILREKGNIINDQLKGDIKLFIKIHNNTLFKRSGLDLILSKTISLKEALCGFSFEITFLNGKSYTLHNTKGNIIPPEYKKVIPNMGVTRGDHKGNLIIHFQTDYPSKLTDEQMSELEKIL
jgi:DnaJ-class molecular chaperone